MKTIMDNECLKTRHELMKILREFFYRHSYIEVETPALMKTVPPDPYIDPLEVFINGTGPCYLHTSPEMHMKKLLQSGQRRIFQLCKVYRVEEFEEMHSIEFTMLEWYREGMYLDAMREVEDLVCFISENVDAVDKYRFKKPFPVFDLENLFVEKAGINPFELERDEFFNGLAKRGFAGIDGRDTWNDLFFKAFIQEVEPKIGKELPYFIMDWPVSISTMAKKKGINKVERFELYMDGVEIANGYTELLDQNEQRERFIADNDQRKKLGKKTFVADEEFLHAIAQLKSSYTGVSLGFDRLLMVLSGKKKIDDVMVNRFKA